MISDSQVTHLQEQGWFRAGRLLDAEACRRLAAIEVGERQNEDKALWLEDRRWLEVATDEAVLACLDGFFGEDDYYLWGAQLITREPGENHPWHSDLETCEHGNSFVSLWIPLQGVDHENGLRVINGSHRYGVALQSLFAWGDAARDDPAAGAVLQAAVSYDAKAALQTIASSEGDGVFFDGRLWHGTFNPGPQPRRALLLQYGRHGAPVRRLLDRQVYPARKDLQRLPDVLCLRGQADPLSNQYIERHEDGLAYPPSQIASRPPWENPQQQAWIRFPYFEIDSAAVEKQICHASQLLPGCMPHMPHTHDLEEFLIVLDGEATIFSEDADKGVLQSIPAAAGDFFYYPAGHEHTIFNSGERPIHYLMLRWLARGESSGQAVPYRYRWSEYAESDERFCIERPSSGLAFLHIHFTRLQPGEGFPRHIDQYDAAVVVLNGRVTMLDQELGPGGVFYSRAGELHNTRNESDQVCEYVVLELHARSQG